MTNETLISRIQEMAFPIHPKGGYDCRTVDEALDEIISAIQSIEAEEAAVAVEVEEHNAKLEAYADTLESEVARLKEQVIRLTSECEKIRTDAEQVIKALTQQ